MAQTIDYTGVCGGRVWLVAAQSLKQTNHYDRLEAERDFHAADQVFDVLLGDSSIAMTLVEIDKLSPHPGAMREAFSLIFRSESQLVLPQRTYSMRNRSIENAEPVGVFLVPIGRDAKGVRYQAVFN